MIEAEMKLADDKVRAVIANLNDLTAQLVADTAKINKQNNKWYVQIITLVAGSVYTLAIIAFVKCCL